MLLFSCLCAQLKLRPDQLMHNSNIAHANICVPLATRASSFRASWIGTARCCGCGAAIFAADTTRWKPPSAPGGSAPSDVASYNIVSTSDSCPPSVLPPTVIEEKVTVEAPEKSFAVPSLSPSARLYTSEGHHHLAADQLDELSLAPLTQFAQRWIYEQQYPADCSNKTFVVTHGHGQSNGIGSQTHFINAQFDGALHAGRILVLHERAGDQWTDRETCGSVTNWECFFRPVTNCSAFVTKENSVILGEMESVLGVHASYVPGPLYRRLRQEWPHLTFQQLRYWWRMQGTAFLMRFNNATVAALRSMRDPISGVPLVVHVPHGPPAPASDHRRDIPPKSAAYEDTEYTRNETFTRALRTQFPFPLGVISAHVRHGDKHTEMALQPMNKYFQAAQDHLVVQQPFGYRRALFISTEDESVLRDANANSAWVFLYSDIPRANTGPLAHVQTLGRAKAGYTVRTHLLQLLMALECDGWVGTRGSNWNRVIDELRCVWVDKCQNEFVEVGTQWENYNWRRF